MNPRANKTTTRSSLQIAATLAFGPILFPACAGSSGTDAAAELGAGDNVELDGPGVRVRPRGSAGTCTFVSTRPALLPAGASLELLWVSSGAWSDGFAAGRTAVVSAGTYRVRSREFSDVSVACPAGKSVDITPVYAGTSVPIPFGQIHRFLSGLGDFRAAFETPNSWHSIPQIAPTDPVGNFYLEDSSYPMPISTLVTASRVIDFAPMMATVHIDLDDVDPGYPTMSSTNVRNLRTSDARSTFGGERQLRALPKDFAVYGGSALDIGYRSSFGSPGGARTTALSIATRTVLTFKRLEVEDFVTDDGRTLPGNFTVTPVAGSVNTFGINGVTHTGVDLLPGTYTVTVTATDARGLPFTDVQRVTL